MEQNNEVRTGSYMIHLLIGLASVLVIVDGIEIYQLMTIWSNSSKIGVEVFSSCVQWELIFRTACSFLSFFAGLSALLLSIGAFYYGNEIYFDAIFHYMSKIFGSTMFFLAIYSFMNFNKFFFVCDKNSLTDLSNLENRKMFSSGNFITAFMSLMIGFVIFVFVKGSEIKKFFLISYHNKYGGSKIYIDTFWKIVFSSEKPSVLLKSAIRHENEIEQNNNPFIVGLQVNQMEQINFLLNEGQDNNQNINNNFENENQLNQNNVNVNNNADINNVNIEP